jgi:hypothetical protein
MVSKLHLAMMVAVVVAWPWAMAQAADPSTGNASVGPSKALRDRIEAQARYIQTPECKANLKEVYEHARREEEKKSGIYVFTNPFVVCQLPCRLLPPGDLTPLEAMYASQPHGPGSCRSE